MYFVRQDYEILPNEVLVATPKKLRFKFSLHKKIRLLGCSIPSMSTLFITFAKRNDVKQ